VYNTIGSAKRICTLLIWRLSAVVFVVFASNFWQRGRRLISFDCRHFYCSHQFHLHHGGKRQRVLDFTHARAWPAPFQMRGQPAGKQARGKRLKIFTRCDKVKPGLGTTNILLLLLLLLLLHLLLLLPVSEF
jgi:hypothetical protein